MKGFTYRGGPLHLINPLTKVSYCRIEKNPNSPLRKEAIKAVDTVGVYRTLYNGEEYEGDHRVCHNCNLVISTLNQNSHSKAIALEPCNLAESVRINFQEHNEAIQEYYHDTREHEHKSI